jgi:hypothetical protein
MGNNILKMYYETSEGFLSLYLVERVYTEDDELVSVYRVEIFVNIEQGSREVVAERVYTSSWFFHFTSALDQGVRECYARGAIKLLFTSEG